MAGSESKKLEIDEQIDALTGKSFDLFSNDLQQFLAEHTLADREDISAKDWWEKILTQGNKHALVKIYVDIKTDPKTGLERDSWKVIPRLGLHHSEVEKARLAPPPEEKEPKKILSMPAEWILKENKAIEDGTYRSKEYKTGSWRFPRPPYWTEFTAGFCAKGAQGGFTVCDFNDKEHPKNQSIEVNASSGESLRVPCLLALPKGRFAAVGLLEVGIEYVFIYDMKAANPSKPVAELQLPVFYFGADDVRISVDPIDRTKFLVTQINFQHAEQRNYYCQFDETTEQLKSEVVYLNYFSPINIFSKNAVLRLSNEPVAGGELPWEEVVSGRDYILFPGFYMSYITTIAPEFKYVSLEMSSSEEMFSADEILKQFYPLTGNSFLYIKDINRCRQLIYYEIQKNFLLPVYTLVATLPSFAPVCIASTGNVFYVSKREVVGSITHSTVSIFDPYTRTTQEFFVFKGKDIKDLILTPDFKLGVCYEAKDGARCDFFPYPKPKLKAQIVIDALPNLPEDTGKIIAEYTFADAKSHRSSRDLFSEELLNLLERIKDLEVRQAPRLLSRDAREVNEAANVQAALKGLRELLITETNLDYDVIQKMIKKEYSHLFSESWLDKFTLSKDVIELRSILSGLDTFPRLQAECNASPAVVIEDEANKDDPTRNAAEQLIKLLQEPYFRKSIYSSPKKVHEREVAIHDLLDLIQEGDKRPTKEELNQFWHQHSEALKWGSLNSIFRQLKQFAVSEKPGPKPK